MPITVVAVTRAGSHLARRLRAGMAGVHVTVPERFAAEDEVTYVGGVGEAVAEAFRTSRALVLIMAVGIAVRSLAPLIADKRRDPAVVVVDDAGRFAISLLSGHLGGANTLAERVAGVLGAVPVVTTASEAAGVPSPDLIGREWGWRIEGEEYLTRVAAALVNGDPVGVWQECGRRDWLPDPLSAHLVEYPTLDALVAAVPAAMLIVSHRVLPLLPSGIPAVVYRPPMLVIGAGASSGAPSDELITLAREALAGGCLAAGSLAAVATLDRKAEEPALHDLARSLGVPLVTYAAAELESVPGEWERSEVVRRAVGTGGVCEPAALLAAGVDRLAVRKRKSAHATVAVARATAEIQIPYSTVTLVQNVSPLGAAR
jgi:cobalt-precorrin 5A hydrolase